MDDETSTVGYWELSLSYPEVSGKLSELAIKKVNGTIATLVEKYRCTGSGDNTFSSEVKYFDKQLLSMSYEAMWLCPPMPSPDSTAGALTFDLDTGAVINIKSAFIDPKAGGKFTSETVSKLRKKVIALEAENQMECPKVEQFSYYYKMKNSLVFVATPDSHSDSGCTANVEYPKSELKRYLKPNSLLLK